MSAQLSLARPTRRRLARLDRATRDADLRIRCRVVLKVTEGMSCREFIEGWYNTRRRHAALDYDSPIDYERRHAVPLPEPTSEDAFPGSSRSHDPGSSQPASACDRFPACP